MSSKNSEVQHIAALGGLGFMNGWFPRHLSPSSRFRFSRIADSTQSDEFQVAARRRWQSYGAELVARGDFDSLITSEINGVTICTGKNAACIAVLSEIVPRLARRSAAAQPWIVDFSTISPRCARAASAYCMKHGVAWAGAPLTGGPKGAEEATMLILFGGPISLYEQIKDDFLAKVGVPRHCGATSDAGAAVKMIGQTMVFGSLQAICGAAAMDTMCHRAGQLGAPEQIDLLKFLNAGAGGMRQLDVALLIGLMEDVWTKRGFLNKHAVIDALYAAQFAAELELSRHGVINPLLNVAAGLALAITEYGPDTATHIHVKNLFGDGARRLDERIHALGYLSVSHVASAIEIILNTLPHSIRETAVLDVEEAAFSV